MITSFEITNFRSIREVLEFTLEAEAGQSKPENFFEVEIAGGQKLRLLKSAVVYGPNASGKTNFIRALYNLTEFIKRSKSIRAESPIQYYEPFVFDVGAEQAPCKFSIGFLMPGEGVYVRYRYQIEFNREEVLTEELDYYPKGQKHNLFKRIVDKSASTVLHTGRLSKDLGYKEYSLFKNQLFLSQFGGDVPHELLTGVYLYFNSVEVWNALDVNKISRLREEIADELLRPENQHLLKRINKLLRIADTRINSISIRENEDKPANSELSNSIFNQVPRNYPRRVGRISATHTLYDKDTEVGVRELPLSQESAGTNVLFALGGIILKRLEQGGVLFFDELDNSLHPKLSKFLVRLFNNPVSNTKNAQLVVATHEVTLLDKEVFRKDQIWFCEKDKYGVTEIFSAKDFDGVRDDTPFDKWYMNGKFGGQPKIKELEFIFDND
ncbi:MAG: AAA family ATPase [Chitinophagaceae bacterium]|nr:AAA family ATPase [Chitinophagaceae bacterium]